MDVELLKSTIESLGGRYDDLPENDVDALRKRLIEVCAGLKGGGGSGSGLPSGGEPHQMLVTDAQGKAGWEDKLCWAEQKEDEFLPETVMVAAEGMFMGNVPVVKEIVAGDTYPVNYNGAAYNCVAQTPPDGGSYFAFGNLGVMAEGFPITEDPFILMVAQLGENLTGMEGVYTMLMPLDGATAVTVSIRGIAEQVKKIDTKYAPGYVFGDFPYKDRVFLKETTIAEISSMGTPLEFDEAIIPDQAYTVTYNGTAYTVIAQKDQTFVSAFALKPTNEAGDVVCQIIIQYETPHIGAIFYGDSPCTLSIIGSGVETVKIPGRLINDAALPFVVTVVRGGVNGTTVESVSHTYDEIEDAYKNGRAIFCWLKTGKTSTTDYLLALHQYSFHGSSFTFQATSWAYDGSYALEDYEVIIAENEGVTIRIVSKAVTRLRIHYDGGLQLTSANGTVYKVSVSDDGTLTATAL